MQLLVTTNSLEYMFTNFHIVTISTKKYTAKIFSSMEFQGNTGRFQVFQCNEQRANVICDSKFMTVHRNIPIFKVHIFSKDIITERKISAKRFRTTGRPENLRHIVAYGVIMKLMTMNGQECISHNWNYSKVTTYLFQHLVNTK